MSEPNSNATPPKKKKVGTSKRQHRTTLSQLRWYQQLARDKKDLKHKKDIKEYDKEVEFIYGTHKKEAKKKKDKNPEGQETPNSVLNQGDTPLTLSKLSQQMELFSKSVIFAKDMFSLIRKSKARMKKFQKPKKIIQRDLWKVKGAGSFFLGEKFKKYHSSTTRGLLSEKRNDTSNSNNTKVVTKMSSNSEHRKKNVICFICDTNMESADCYHTFKNDDAFHPTCLSNLYK